MDKSFKIVCLFFAVSLLLTFNAFCASLSLEQPTTSPASQFQVHVNVDDSTQVMGAAFTVDYDTSVLEVISAESTFFNTFLKQFTEEVSPVCSACPTEVTVDGIVYEEPLVTHPATGEVTGTRLAAARAVEDAAPGVKTIFTLNFQFIGGVEGQTYPIEIVPTELLNADAGYPTATEIDLLVGYDSGTDSFTKPLPPATYNANPTGSVDSPPAPGGPTFNFDIDDNGSVEPFNDGFLILRYLLGSGGDNLISGAIGAGAQRNTSVAIESYLIGAYNDLTLDIDDNGSVEPFNDGFLILRYLLGSGGDNLISGAIGAGAQRNTSVAIESYLLGLML